jgi:hypothetical protein
VEIAFRPASDKSSGQDNNYWRSQGFIIYFDGIQETEQRIWTDVFLIEEGQINIFSIS